MSVILDPSSLKRKSNVDLSTTDATRINRINRVKQDLDKFFQENSTKYTSQTTGLPYIDLYGYPIDSELLKLVPKQMVLDSNIGPFGRDGKDIFLATSNPDEVNTIQPVINWIIEQGYGVKLYVCSSQSMEKLVKSYDFLVENIAVNDDINISEERLKIISSGDVSLNDIQSKGSKMSMTELIEFILVAAYRNDASDIHFEPEKNSYILRLRLDGVLHTFAEFEKEKQRAIESRLKIISKLKLNIDDKPQDGRFTFKVDGKEIDVRVSMLPSNYGYSVVMRLLGTFGTLTLDKLGFNPVAQAIVEQCIQKPQGLILTTGPTGSGKTTTLYSFLSILNDGGTKIITLEDPIEYKLPGISQTQIDVEVGYTFAAGLRSILRQDPDMVMVGEIRDQETAQIATQAALTGHKVLSTIHTNDATGAIPRLLDMEIKPYILADSLTVVIGQRLGRKLCPHCMYQYIPTQQEIDNIQPELEKLSQNPYITLPKNPTFYSSKGCEKCNNLGYKGRIGFYEVLTITPAVKDLLSKEFVNFNDLRKTAEADGMITMKQDAILKAMQGVTNIAELMRVVS